MRTITLWRNFFSKTFNLSHLFLNILKSRSVIILFKNMSTFDCVELRSLRIFARVFTPHELIQRALRRDDVLDCL